VKPSKLASALTRPVVTATGATAVLAAIAIGAVGIEAHSGGGFTPTAASSQLTSGAPTTAPPTTAPPTTAPPTTQPPTTAPPTSVPPAPTPDCGANVNAPGTPITWVQANIKDGMAADKTAADVRTVYAEAPDFVSFNEVEWRSDATLTAAGYSLFRTPGQYSGETPIAWNTSRWTEVAEGTTVLSNNQTIPKGRSTKWGVRYANWVTVVNAAGQKVSAVSVHAAPATSTKTGYGDLLTREVRKLGALTNQLVAQGPVLVGGDFNVQFDSARYPRTLLSSYGLTPTYDVLQQKLVTGDYDGGTIDYLYLDRASSFSIAGQCTHELNSDHKAVITHLRLLTPGDPNAAPMVFTHGKVSAAKGVRKLTLAAIDNAPRGAVLHVATRSLRGNIFLKALTNAHKRGVGVQVIVGDSGLTGGERALRRQLGHRTGASSFFARAPKAFAGRGRLPQTALLASQSGATAALRVRATGPITPQGLRKAVARVATTKAAYDQLFRTFMKAVGRKV
jgi:endonuclease/exonuclease/phosphatase family metal-dependent hydrolase